MTSFRLTRRAETFATKMDSTIVHRGRKSRRPARGLVAAPKVPK